MELRILKTDGWMTEDNKLTRKAIEFIEQIEATFHVKQKKNKKIVLGDDAADYINQYRELFPKGNLPSGSPARVNVRDLERKFTWFFNTYNYDWATILEATRRYVESFEAAGYKFMKTSAYFISKQDREKGIVSELASVCDQVLDGEEEVQEITVKMR